MQNKFDAKIWTLAVRISPNQIEIPSRRDIYPTLEKHQRIETRPRKTNKQQYNLL